jgi:hypothetical protein
MDMNLAFVANLQASKRVKPGNRALGPPTRFAESTAVRQANSCGQGCDATFDSCHATGRRQQAARELQLIFCGNRSHAVPERSTNTIKSEREPAASAETRLKEKPMEKSEKPLRFTVEKWLAMVHAMSAQVRRGSCAGSNQTRSVCVEASISTGTFAIYLFRQDDGTWCVFPPHVERPAMTVA